tara:strand:+ start:3588 stop:4088 length:501 start_codon:yes stop_codon:yes gene_type:complete
MVNYQNAKIYKITSKSTNLIYVGSTTKFYLSQRLANHQTDYKLYLNGGRTYITSFQLMEHPDRIIELIEKFPCESKEELLVRERYWIENTECVNRNIPSRTRAEWWRENLKADISTPEYKAKRAEHDKRYREANRDKIKTYRSTPEYKAKKAEQDKRYKAKKKASQ